MRALLDKFAQKLVAAGLAKNGEPLLAGLDDELAWNLETPADDPRTALLEPLFEDLSINSLVLTRPPDPYAAIIGHLAEAALAEQGQSAAIQPQDCETRTFLHDLPVVCGFDRAAMAAALSRRKGVIIHTPGEHETPGQGPYVLAYGTVSPEQGFVTASSICFACFVKFFADSLACVRFGTASGLPPPGPGLLRRVVGSLRALNPEPPKLMRAPFAGEEQVYRALIEAGRATVDYGLVDSYFGNISYSFGGALYISQTGSSLDELAGHIDPCPLSMEQGGSTAGLTASSELSAHMEALERSGAKAMLHGHPPFSVILSLDCHKLECPNKGRCHLACSEKRSILDAPIVPGEVGTGTFGLCNTLPPALAESGRAIVYGHGVFALGHEDFNEAFAALLQLEKDCRASCLARLEALQSAEEPGK